MSDPLSRPTATRTSAGRVEYGPVSDSRKSVAIAKLFNFQYCGRVKILTTQEAVECLGIIDARARILTLSGGLPSHRFGRSHMIKETDLRLILDRKLERPAKAKEVMKKAKGKQK